MSLVNDMLNDLDERRTEQPAQKENLEWLTGHATVKKKKPLPIYSLVVAVLLIVMLAVIYQQYTSRSALNNVEQIMASAKVGGSTPAKLVVSKSELKPAPNVLKAVRFKRLAKETIIVLALSEKPNYTLSDNKGALIITLSGLDSTLPQQLESAEPPFKSLSFSQSANDLQLRLNHTGKISYHSQWISEPSNQLNIVVSMIETPTLRPAPTSQSSKQVMVAANIEPSVTTVSEKSAAAVSVEPVPKSSQRTLLKKAAPLTVGQQDRRAVQQARIDLRTNNVDAAIKRLQSFLAKYSKAKKSSALLIELLIDQKRLPEAQSILNGLSAQLGESSELRRLQAHVYVLTSAVDKAVSLLLSKQPNIKTETAYYELLALAAQRDKQYPLSIQVYKSLLRHDSGMGSWWIGLAISQDLYGLKADARVNFQQAIRAGRLSQSLRDYARRRHNALAGAVNDPLLKSSEEEANVE